MSRRDDADATVMHFEAPSDGMSSGRSLCGVTFPTAGFHTDDEGEFSDREGSRCKRCWRSFAKRYPEWVS